MSGNQNEDKLKKHNNSVQANKNKKLTTSSNLPSANKDSGDASSGWYNMMKELKQTISDGQQTSNSIIENRKHDLVSFDR